MILFLDELIKTCAPLENVLQSGSFKWFFSSFCMQHASDYQTVNLRLKLHNS